MKRESEVLSGLSSSLLVVNYALNYNIVLPWVLNRLFSMGFYSLDNNIPELIAYLLVLGFTVALSWPALSWGWKQYVRNFRKNTLSIFSFFFIMLAVTVVTSLIISKATGTETSINESDIDYYFENAPYYFAFVAVVFAPIVEECVFRLAIHKRLAASGHKVLGILVASLLFGFIHVYSSIFSGNYLDLAYLAVYSAMGLVISLLYEKTGSIWCCIMLHMLNNALAGLY